MVAHLKSGTASHGFISVRESNNNIAYAMVDFSAGTSTHGSYGSVTNPSSTVTALGSDWYRLTLTATVSSGVTLAFVGISDGTAVGSSGYDTGWNSTGQTMYAWGVQLSSTNSKVYDSPTTTQISRSYSPVLKTAAANEPRFEYAADGQSVGTALGLLVESQVSNLLTYSEDWTNSDFTKFVAITSNAGIAPTGELAADLVTATSSAGDHITRQSLTVVSGQTYTMSVFAKASGCNFVRIGGASTAVMPAQASFDLVNGTVGTVDYGTAKIEDVGNGFYRCSVTGTAASNTSTHLEIRLMQSDNTPSWTGDDYSGLLLFGQMAEQSSSVSSYIKTTSSSVSRAADSCSVADFGYTGGPVSVMSETTGGSGSFPGCWVIKNSTGSEALQLYKQSAAATEATGFRVYANSGGTNTVDTLITSSASAGKIAVSYDTNDVAFTASGNAVQTDTSASSIGAVDTLIIGGITTTNQLNGHIKRVALYNVALSDTELQALTS
jgi:hypothetical protein